MRAFVYGTLTDSDRVADLLPDGRFAGDATLAGLHRVDGRYPTLAPGGRTGGRLLVTDRVDLLDAYEGVEDGLYVRVSVPREDGGEAAVYVGDPARLDAPGAAWPGDGPFAERVRHVVAAHGVRIASAPRS